MGRPRRSSVAGAAPLTSRAKWRAILLATLLLVPAYWALLAGTVAVASDDANGPAAAPYIAFGLALIPFVYIVLAVLSDHPAAPMAIVKAMLLTLVIGIPVSALAGDAVTGVVAGIGAGGVIALRPDPLTPRRNRAVAVLAAAAGVFLLVRVVPEMAILLAPCLPFTSIAIADHLGDRTPSAGTDDRRPI